MNRLLILLLTLFVASPVLAAAGPTVPKERQDLYFGEALYHAYQGKWFDAISRLDTELELFHNLDEPQLDIFSSQRNQAEFNVGDFELAYRMHLRAGRAIKAVIEGDVEESVRNEALYRLAQINFRKGQPIQALQALDRIRGETPTALVDDIPALRAEVLMTHGGFEDAATILRGLQSVPSLKGFAPYNLGIALLRNGNKAEGIQWLDRAGQVEGDDRVTTAIRDKANLVLGEKRLGEQDYEGAKEALDRVRLNGPFSNRALLGSGWADAYRGYYDRALVPWTILAEGNVTDASVQEALLAVPYAYGRIGLYSNAAMLYGWALESFGTEGDKLEASIKSIRAGKFLEALVREELKQDTAWVVRLRELPEAPETYYLLDLMAANDFQESLKNYLDLEALRRKLERWQNDLVAFEEVIALRRSYYEPLLPEIDRKARRLTTQLRLAMEQRQRIQNQLKKLLVAPRPDALATADERIDMQRLTRLEQLAETRVNVTGSDMLLRTRRLQGLLLWTQQLSYDQRLAEAFTHLQDLDAQIDRMNRQYRSFVRARQTATQSYQGYDDEIRTQRIRLAESLQKVQSLMTRQGDQLEAMAINELTRRRDRLAEFQIKARFALADSYDRASQTQERKEAQP